MYEFIVINKAYDRISEESLKQALINKEFSKVCVNVDKGMYEGKSTKVRKLCGKTEHFHPGSVLSPY